MTVREPKARRWLVPALGVGILLLALVSGLASAGSAVPSQTGCAYGQCSNTTPFTLSTVEIILIILAIVAVALGILYARGRRRAGRSSEPPTPWSAGPPAGGEGGEGAEAASLGAGVGAGAAAVGGSHPYVEGPDDQAVAQPGLPTAAAAGAASGEEPDIDSLMQELDKISGEILQRNAPKKEAPPGKGEATEGGEGSGEGGSGTE